MFQRLELGEIKNKLNIVKNEYSNIILLSFYLFIIFKNFYFMYNTLKIVTHPNGLKKYELEFKCKFRKSVNAIKYYFYKRLKTAF